MWDLPGPGLEPVSPALAGGFLTTEPPGKPGTSLSTASPSFLSVPSSFPRVPLGASPGSPCFPRREPLRRPDRASRIQAGHAAAAAKALNIYPFIIFVTITLFCFSLTSAHRPVLQLQMRALQIVPTRPIGQSGFSHPGFASGWLHRCWSTRRACTRMQTVFIPAHRAEFS